MLLKWKQAVDNGQAFGALLTDLSKAFNCLPQKLLIPKTNACALSLKALKLINNYLFQRNQRTKVNKSYSSWEQILFGVPQDSVSGPILFNIFVSGLFLGFK